MEIQSGLDGLKSLLGVNSAAPASSAAESKNNAAATSGSGLGSDRATLSSAASEMAQSAGDDGVRMDKVSSIQSALAAGTYNVPASAVAGKIVDSMLGS